MKLPPMTVTFDDGPTIEIQPKSRDMVRAEEAGHDFTESGSMRTMYATALATLGRLQRYGEPLLKDFELPDTVAGFIDCADVDPITGDEDAEGKGSGQGAATG